MAVLKWLLWVVLPGALSGFPSSSAMSRPTLVPGSPSLQYHTEFPYTFWRPSAPRRPTPLTPRPQNYNYYYGKKSDEGGNSDPSTWQALPIQIPNDLVGDAPRREATSTPDPPVSYPTRASPQYGRHPGATEAPHLYHPERHFHASNDSVAGAGGLSQQYQLSPSAEESATTYQEPEVHYDHHWNNNQEEWSDQQEDWNYRQGEYHAGEDEFVQWNNNPENYHDRNDHVDYSHDWNSEPEDSSSWRQSIMDRLEPLLDTRLPKLPTLPSLNSITRLPKLPLWPFNTFRGSARPSRQQVMGAGHATLNPKRRKYKPPNHHSQHYDHETQGSNTLHYNNEFHENPTDPSLTNDGHYFNYSSNNWHPTASVHPTTNTESGSWASEGTHSDHQYVSQGHGGGNTYTLHPVHTFPKRNPWQTLHRFTKKPFWKGESSNNLQWHENESKYPPSGSNHYTSGASQRPHRRRRPRPRPSLRPTRPHYAARPEPEGQQSSSSFLTTLQNYLLPGSSFPHQEQGIIERLTGVEAVPAGLAIPGGMLAAGISLAIFYFNYVWYPTPVVTAKMVKMLSDLIPDLPLSAGQQKAISEMYEVFRSLDETPGEGLWSGDCRSRLVCRLHHQLPSLWTVTNTYADLLKSRLARTTDGEDDTWVLNGYLQAARWGARGDDCSDHYPQCHASHAPLTNALRTLLKLAQTDT